MVQTGEGLTGRDKVVWFVLDCRRQRQSLVELCARKDDRMERMRLRR